MVTHGVLVQAAALGGHALLATLARPPHSGLALLTGEVRTGVCVTARLSTVTHTRGAAVFLPLLAVLVLLPGRQTGVSHALWTALTWPNHQVLTGLAGHRLAQGSRTLDLAVVTHTLGTQTGPPLLPITIHRLLPRAGGSVAGTLGAALPRGGEQALVWPTVERRTGAGGAGHPTSRTHTHSAVGASPLAVVLVGLSLIETGAGGLGLALWTALVSRDPQMLTLLVVTARVRAVGGATDGDVTVAGALLARLRSP